MKTRIAMLALLSLALFVPAARAGEVTVKGVHLCCGACVGAVAKALKPVEGVSGAACDREKGTVTFTAANDDAAQAGINALADAGFFGTAAHGDKKVAFPESGVKKDAKGDNITLYGVHLCCGACSKAVDKALADSGGEVTIDRKARTVAVVGKGLDLSAIVAALNKAGFYGSTTKPDAGE